MARFFSRTTNKIQKSSVGNAAANNYTFFCLVKPINFADGGYLMYNGHGGSFGEGYGVYINGDTLELRVDLSFVFDYASGLKVPFGRWSRIAYCRRSGTSFFVANGKRSPTTTGSTPFTPNLFYTLGAYCDENGVTSAEMTGALAHCALWNAALSNQELIGLTRGLILPHQVQRNNLSQYHRLMGGQNTTEKPFLKGDDMTITSVRPYPHPRLYRDRPRIEEIYYSVKAPAAAAAVRQYLPIMGIGS